MITKIFYNIIVRVLYLLAGAIGMYAMVRSLACDGNLKIDEEGVRIIHK